MVTDGLHGKIRFIFVAKFALMRIPLPFGNCVYVGKDIREKSAVVARNSSGGVTGTYEVSGIDRFLDCFSPATYLRNFIFLYENIAEIYFPIHYLTSRIKNGNFVVRRWSDDAIVWADTDGSQTDRIVGTQMKRLLSRPNVMQSFKEFVEQAFVYRYLTGDCYIYASTVPTATVSKNLWKYCSQFWVLPSQYVRVMTGASVPLFRDVKRESIIEGYLLQCPYGNHLYEPSLVLHMRDNHSLEIAEDYFTGRSRLLALKYPISNLCAVYEARNVIYTKRGALGALVNMKKDADTYLTLAPDEKKSIRQEFQDNYGVTDRRDPIAIIDVPVQYIQFGLSIQDLQPFEESLTDSATIAGIYNIDSVLIPRKENSTFANLKEAECKVYTSTIIPDVKGFCEDMSEFLGLNAAGYYLDATWDHVEVLQEARSRREAANKSISDRCRTEFLAGLISYNEWRVAVGKERISSDLYDKTVLQMTEEEYLSIGARIK